MLLTRETGLLSDLSQIPTELEKPVSVDEKIAARRKPVPEEERYVRGQWKLNDTCEWM